MATQLLLADDSPTIAKILKMALHSEPYEIRSVLNAEDALKELKAHPPFFFLVDLSLPEKNGYEFARLIRRDSKLRDVRVVLLASAFEPVDEGEYHTCGADGLIKKPFDPAELRRQLRSILEAPPKYPDGAKVTGSLSGFTVNSPDDSTATGLVILPAKALTDAERLTGLIEGNTPPANEADADQILAGLLQSGEAPEAPPPFASPLTPTIPVAPKGGKAEFTNATIALDLSGNVAVQADDVLDISRSFNTPPGGTALIEMPESPRTPEDQPLSANAQALAAFFEAELQTAQVAPEAAPAAAPATPARPNTPPAPAARDESFDASLSAWSSSQPKGAPEGPPPFKKADALTSAAFAPVPPSGGTKPSFKPGETNAGRAGEGSSAQTMFDTGGASFRFSDDYIHRITKAFTGAEFEHVPDAHAATLFRQQSDDRPAAAPMSGGGAWSEGDVQKIERIVREEVQMVVREVAEKIAWEVIPELAENLIRKELERVLKELGQ